MIGYPFSTYVVVWKRRTESVTHNPYETAFGIEDGVDDVIEIDPISNQFEVKRTKNESEV